MHTVGPCVGGMLTPQHCTALAQCCRSCLQLMPDSKLKTIAFCCISTGVFRFTKDKAAAIALHEVRAFRQVHPEITVLFNVFEAQDFEIYRALLRYRNALRKKGKTVTGSGRRLPEPACRRLPRRRFSEHI